MSERKEVREEEEEKKKIAIYLSNNNNTLLSTLLNSLKPTDDGPKQQIGLRIEPSIHHAAKFLAPYFQTTVQELYAEAITKHLESLIPQLPENIQLNVIRQITMRQEADPEIVGLKTDIAHEELAYLIKRVRKAPQSTFLADALRKQLVQSFKLASTSGNDSLKRLVFEARELLRRPSIAEEVRAPAKREKPFDYSVYRPYSLDELRAQHQALKEKHQRGLIPDETFLLQSQPLAFEISRREHKLKEGN